MELQFLQILAYLLLGAAVTFYVVLDGFDLGVGSLHLLVRGDKNRRMFLNSIGPFWDGNEVWLVIIVGVMFVAFPDMYAIVLSGLYLLLMCFLSAIIFRAVAIEFRSKHPSKAWRSAWDIVFWLSSIFITFGAGVALGNLIKGVPVDATRELYYPFHCLFTGYPVCVGISSIILFAMHGNHFLLMKTEGELHKQLRRWIPYTIALFIIALVIMTIWTALEFPYMHDHFIEHPLFWAVPLLLVLVIGTMCVFTAKRCHGWAFLMSMLTITLMFVLYMMSTFPKLIISSLGKETLSLTLYNASSSYTTLAVTLIIAALGVPLVLAYGWVLYHIFRGKTQLHEHSY